MQAMQDCGQRAQVRRRNGMDARGLMVLTQMGALD